jgi:single-stranded DNA-binding protein
LFGVKGRVQSRIVESPDGLKRRKTEIVAERVTFLTSDSSRRENEKSEQEENKEE